MLNKIKFKKKRIRFNIIKLEKETIVIFLILTQFKNYQRICSLFYIQNSQ